MSFLSRRQQAVHDQLVEECSVCDRKVQAEAARLEMHMLAAIAKGDAAMAAYARTRNVQHLMDGLLDVRNRLMKGLPDETR